MTQPMYSREVLHRLAATERESVFAALTELTSMRTELEKISFEERMDVMVRLAMVLNRMENEDIEVLDRTRSLMVSLLLNSDGYIARTVPDTLNTLMEVITQRISIQRLSAENMRIICFTVLQVLMECTSLLPTDQFVVDLYGCLHSQIWPYTTQLMDPAIVIKEWQLSDEEDIQLVHSVMAWKHPTISPLVAQIWSMVYIALIVSGALLALVACVFCDPWHQGFVITGTGLIVLGYHCLSKVSREHNRRHNLVKAIAKRSTPLLEGHVTIVPPLSPIPDESEAIPEEPSADGSTEVDLVEPFTNPLSIAPRSVNEKDMAAMANIMDQMNPSEMYATLKHLNTLLDEADDVSLETKERVKQGMSLLEPNLIVSMVNTSTIIVILVVVVVCILVLAGAYRMYILTPPRNHDKDEQDNFNKHFYLGRKLFAGIGSYPYELFEVNAHTNYSKYVGRVIQKDEIVKMWGGDDGLGTKMWSKIVEEHTVFRNDRSRIKQRNFCMRFLHRRHLRRKVFIEETNIYLLLPFERINRYAEGEIDLRQGTSTQGRRDSAYGPPSERFDVCWSCCSA